MIDWRADYLATTARLLEGRVRAGLSQAEVAVALKVSRRTFQRWGGGQFAPDARWLFFWSAVVGVRLASNLTPEGA